MKCSKCNTENPNGAKFCGVCGQSFVNNGDGTESTNPKELKPVKSTEKKAKQEKVKKEKTSTGKSKASIIIPLVLVVILILGALGAYFVIGKISSVSDERLAKIDKLESEIEELKKENEELKKILEPDVATEAPAAEEAGGLFDKIVGDVATEAPAAAAEPAAVEEEAPAATEEDDIVEAAVEEAKNSSDFTPETDLVFDRNGCKVVVEKYDLKNKKIKLKVTNNHPDNKKIDFNIQNVGVNGVVSYAHGNVYDLKVGDSAEIDVSINDNLITKCSEVYGKLGAPDLDVQYITFNYYADGIEEKYIYGSKTIYTDKYVKGDLTQYYGEFVETISNDYGSYDLYVKGNDGAVLVTGICKEMGDYGYSQGFDFLINGQGSSSLKVEVANNLYMSCPNTISVLAYTADAKAIRAELEIPNDQAIEYMIRDNYSYEGYQVYSMK